MAVKVSQADIKSVMCPAVNGVRSEAQAVRIHNGSTWVDVWTSVLDMPLISNSITRGMLAINDYNSMQYSKTMASGTGSVAGGGTMVFCAEGEWVNPTISFSYEGSFLYESSVNNYVSGNAGSISVYHRIKGASSAGTTTVLSKVGKEGVNNFEADAGTVSKTLSGTYDRLGISITIPTYGGTYTFATLILSVGTITVGAKRLGFRRSDMFDYY